MIPPTELPKLLKQLLHHVNSLPLLLLFFFCHIMFSCGFVVLTSHF